MVQSGVVVAQLEQGRSERPSDRRRRVNLTDALREAGKVRWETNLGDGNKFEVVSLVVSPNAILAVNKQQAKFRARPQWYLTALNVNNGKSRWQRQLSGQPLPGGLLVDQGGQVVVAMLDGRLLCFGPGQ